MKTNSRKKQFIFLTLMMAIAVFFAFQFRAVAEESALVSVAGLNQTNEIGRDTLAILLQLQALSLDGSLFEDAVFKYLTDFSVTLVARPIGRENPFAAIDLEEALKNQTPAESDAKPAL